ncbi:MAG: fatty acid desaturase [Pseudomonadota bacterium]
MATALLSIGAWWLVAPAVIVAAAMGLRIYMIQHDCLHRSFFTSRKVNDVVGTLLSPIAMTPYKATRYIHGQHHTYVSDLDHREAFEIYTMTLDEWHAASWWEKLQYRLYRSPITLIFLGPFVLYTVLRRMPLYGFKTGIGDLVLHNLLLAAYVVGVYWIAGWPGIGVWLASVYVACATGALIPYVVHNFEHILWGTRPDLTFESAALDGSAVLDWGRLFDIVTMNIGYHDLHHLNAKIPGYHLREAHHALESEGFLRSHKISFWEGIRCMRWKLYDEQKQCMIPFSAVSKAAGAVPAE